MTPQPPSDLPAKTDDAPSDLQRLLTADGRQPLALLADDNAINREVGVALLEELGLLVHTARDGREAVDRFAAGHYDLVLMDMQMPRLDGLDATREIRATAQGAHVPVIAMTANAFEQNLADCLAAGMNDVVTKPVDIRQLAATLARWLR